MIDLIKCNRCGTIIKTVENQIMTCECGHKLHMPKLICHCNVCCAYDSTIKAIRCKECSKNEIHEFEYYDSDCRLFYCINCTHYWYEGNFISTYHRLKTKEDKSFEDKIIMELMAIIEMPKNQDRHEILDLAISRARKW